MVSVIRYGVVLAAVAFFAYVENVFNPFWLWNAAPVIAGLFFAELARRSGSSTLPPDAFLLFATVPLVLLHYAWLVDWNETATGSSTSGLIFLFAPVYASVLGAIGFGLAFLGIILRKRFGTPEEPPESPT